MAAVPIGKQEFISRKASMKQKGGIEGESRTGNASLKVAPLREERAGGARW